MYVALGGLVHVVGVAEQTLCCVALEGAELGGAAMPVVPQKIGCEECVSLIEYVKQIPNKHHRERKRPVRKTRFSES